jgi:hypothetical protein
MFENCRSHLRDQRRPTNCDLSKGVRVVQTLGEEPSELRCLRQGSLIVPKRSSQRMRSTQNSWVTR